MPENQTCEKVKGIKKGLFSKIKRLTQKIPHFATYPPQQVGLDLRRDIGFGPVS